MKKTFYLILFACMSLLVSSDDAYEYQLKTITHHNQSLRIDNIVEDGASIVEVVDERTVLNGLQVVSFNNTLRLTIKSIPCASITEEDNTSYSIVGSCFSIHSSTDIETDVELDLFILPKDSLARFREFNNVEGLKLMRHAVHSQSTHDGFLSYDECHYSGSPKNKVYFYSVIEFRVVSYFSLSKAKRCK